MIIFISDKAASLKKLPTSCWGGGEMQVEWQAVGVQKEHFDLCLQQKNGQRNHCTDATGECQKGLEANHGGFDC